MSAGRHPTAINEATDTPDDIEIGAYSVIAPGVSAAPGVRIGAQVAVARGVRLGRDVIVRDGAVLAAEVTVGDGAVVSEGAVVTRSVPPHAVVAGNPARITGYIESDAGGPMEPIRHDSVDDAPSITDTAIRGVQLHRLPVVRDLRGSLVAGELEDRLPFVARRFFLVFDVPGEEVRGEHAHHACHQFLVCMHGQVHVIADDGHQRQEFVLSDNRTGLYLPPLVWGTQYRYSSDCTLLVLASHPYEAQDYIRDYDTFVSVARERSQHA